MSNNRFYFLLILIISCLSLEAQEGLVDQGMGKLYLEQARFLMEQGDSTGAESFLDRAKEYIPDSLELHYLSMEIRLERGTEPYALIGLDRSSSGISPVDEAWDRLRLPLLARTKQYDFVRKIYLKWGDRVFWDANELLCIARSFSALGEDSLAVSILETGLDHYPLNLSLLGLLLNLSEPARERFTQRLEENLFQEESRADDITLLLLQGAGRRDFPFLWKRYRSQGLRSLEAEIRRGELYGWDSSPPLVSLAEMGLFEDGFLTSRARKLLFRQEDISLFDQLLSWFNGEMTYDLNSDGFKEISVSYIEGVVSGITEDFNQDGEPEAILSFNGELPESLILAGQRAVVEYSRYPWVSRVIHNREGRYLGYEMGDERYRLSFNTLPESFEPPRIRVEWDWGELIKKAIKVSLYTSDSPEIRQRYEQLWGNRRITRFSSGLQGEDRRLFSEDGLLVREERFILGRSAPDTLITYEKGFVREVLHDADGDGNYEYREWYYDLTDRMRYHIYWDLDGDGTVDLQETLGAEHRVRRYSPEGESPLTVLIP